MKHGIIGLICLFVVQHMAVWECPAQTRDGGPKFGLDLEWRPLEETTRGDRKREWKDPVTGMEFVWVPGGCFHMGQTESEKTYLVGKFGEENYREHCTDELPRHEVCVDGFWMAEHEVTVDQFGKFVEATGYVTEAERDEGCWTLEGEWKKNDGTSWLNPPYVDQRGDHPVVCVSWNDSITFAEWLSRESGKDIRLPTEAEWEYACRAGSTAMRFWGDREDNACQYANAVDLAFKKRGRPSNYFDCDDGYATTAPVGSYRPNSFGLHDMLGNVIEWCQDRYDKNAYSKHGRNNPIYDEDGSGRVARGGGWDTGSGGVACGNRSGGRPDGTGGSLGFRLLRTN